MCTPTVDQVDPDDGRRLWPRPPLLPRPIVMDQRWERLVFLHWRVPSQRVAPLLPAGTVPDEFDGTSWVGLIGFRMVGAGFGYRRPVPYFGTFPEINVRLYSVDTNGRRGVVFRSLEASRLAVVAGTNLVGVPYRWASITIEDDETSIAYRSNRLAPPQRGSTTSFGVHRGSSDVSDDPLAQFLTARWGLPLPWQDGFCTCRMSIAAGSCTTPPSPTATTDSSVQRDFRTYPTVHRTRCCTHQVSPRSSADRTPYLYVTTGTHNASTMRRMETPGTPAGATRAMVHRRTTVRRDHAHTDTRTIGTRRRDSPQSDCDTT